MKKLKETTITKKITYTISIIIIIEIIFVSTFFLVGNIGNKIKANTFSSYSKSMEIEVMKLNNELNEMWETYNLNILRLPDYLNNSIDLSITEQQELLKDLEFGIEEFFACPLTTGFFIILENNLDDSSEEITKEGLYFRKSAENTILPVVAPPTYIINTPVRNYDKNFIINKSNPNAFSLRYLNNSVIFKNQIERNAVLYDYNNIESFYTFTFPVYDTEDRYIAFAGVEFKVSNFLNKVNFKNNSSLENTAFVFARMDKENDVVENIMPLTYRGPLFDQGLEIDDSIELNNQIGYDNFMYLKDANFGNDAVIGNLYDFDFSDQYEDLENELVVVGLINQQTLLDTVRFIDTLIAISIILPVVFGVIIIYICIKYLVNPIRNLSYEVLNSPINEVVLKKSNITEINELIKSIEKLSMDVVEYSQKITNAIDIFSLGIFFYHDDSTEVYCSQPFYDICGIRKREGYIEKNDFSKLLEKITNSDYDFKYSAYRLLENKWIKIVTKKDSNFNLGIVTDVTNQIIEIRKIEKERDIDPLTKIYNRAAFNKLAEKYFNNPEVKVIAVIMWDIDKLKYINDAYGHDAGDRYICKFADVIRTLEEYGGLVSRRSGDEFLGLLVGNSHSDIIKILNDLRANINDAYITISDNLIEKLRVSTGIAWYPDDGDNLSTLINYADFALYEVKYNARGITNYFSKDSMPQLSYLVHYNDELDKIIEGDFITFAYQPIIDAKNGEIFGYEFLMRIFNEVINSPEKLTTLARLQSKLHLVEDVTFKKAFETYNNYLEYFKDKKVFINSISNIILCDKTIKEITKNRSNNLDMLVMELTEFDFAENEVIANKIEIMKGLNSKIAIDNFRPENIDYLDSYHIFIDYIKIDMSIIDNINIDEMHQKYITDICQYAKERNIKTIAVGIKSFEEMKYVIEAGVDYLQGFYLAMPSAKPTILSDNIYKKIIDLNKPIN